MNLKMVWKIALPRAGLRNNFLESGHRSPIFTERLARFLRWVVSRLLSAPELTHSILFPIRMFGLLKKKRERLHGNWKREKCASSFTSLLSKIMHKLQAILNKIRLPFQWAVSMIYWDNWLLRTKIPTANCKAMLLSSWALTKHIRALIKHI